MASDLHHKPPVPHQATPKTEKSYEQQGKLKKKKKPHNNNNKKEHLGGEKPQGKELRCSGQARKKVSILLPTLHSLLPAQLFVSAPSQLRQHFPFKWHLSADMLEAPILHRRWQMVQLATIFGIA